MLQNNTSGSLNTANGAFALDSNTNGSYNTAIGAWALEYNTSGSYNIALGFQAGINFTGSESSNIDIGNPGVTGDNNTIRIGSGQTQTFIAGVINGNGAGLTGVTTLNLKQVALLKWGVSSADNTFSVGSEPYAICFDGANIWVANEGSSGTVTKLNASTGATLGTYSIGSYHDGICFRTEPASGWRTTSQRHGDEDQRQHRGRSRHLQCRINSLWHLFRRSQHLGGERNSGTVTQAQRQHRGHSRHLQCRIAPDGIRFAHGASIWVANNESGTVTKLNASTGATLGTYSVGTYPAGICFDGASIWVANEGQRHSDEAQCQHRGHPALTVPDCLPMPSVSTEPASG